MTDRGEIERRLVEASQQEAGWVREMKKYFEKHNRYRISDIRRLLGDPMERIDAGNKKPLRNK